VAHPNFIWSISSALKAYVHEAIPFHSRGQHIIATTKLLEKRSKPRAGCHPATMTKLPMPCSLWQVIVKQSVIAGLDPEIHRSSKNAFEQ
jgi:hypothetical protein